MTVASGAILSGNGTAGNSVDVKSGGFLAPAVNTSGTRGDFGVAGTLTVVGAVNLETGSALDFDLSSMAASGNDLISMGGVLSLGSSLTFNFNELSGGLQLNTPYILVSGFTNAPSLTSEVTNFISGLSYTPTYSIVGDALEVSFSTAGPVESTNYYFTGGAGTNVFTTAGNFSDMASAGTTHLTAPGSTSDVFLNATGAANTPATLTTATTINSLTMVTPNSSLGGSGTLTLASTGTALLDSATGATTETVSPTVALGASQTWAVTSSTNTLQIGGPITGAHALTLNGGGTFQFANGNSTYSGGTHVTGNTKLLLANSTGTTTLGSGTLTVDPGSLIGGAGNASGLAAFHIGAGSGGTAQVQVGAGGNDTTGGLTLAASGASDITNANLTFNLNSAIAGQANLLDLDGTPVTLSGSTLTLNLIGTNVIAPGTTYVLIRDSAGFAGLNVPQGQDGMITSGLSIATSTYFGASLGNGGYTTGLYPNSFLVVTDGGTEIEVEVVPEPSTWALILGGLAALVFGQRRKSRQQECKL
jgi:hypothetical protein